MAKVVWNRLNRVHHLVPKALAQLKDTDHFTLDSGDVLIVTGDVSHVSPGVIPMYNWVIYVYL